MSASACRLEALDVLLEAVENRLPARLLLFFGVGRFDFEVLGDVRFACLWMKGDANHSAIVDRVDDVLVQLDEIVGARKIKTRTSVNLVLQNEYSIISL